MIWLLVNIKISLRTHNQVKSEETKLLKLVFKFFDKKSSDGIKNETKQN